jgi:Kef-type K+ transport system membrane component KefB
MTVRKARAVSVALALVAVARVALGQEPGAAPSAAASAMQAIVPAIPAPLAAPSPHTGLLRVVLGLAAAFVLAIAATHPLVRRIERRLGLTVLLSSGLPFLAMGFVFRLPSVGVLTDDVVSDLRPVLEFGLGWLGFVVGMHFDMRELDTLPPKTGNVVVVESAIPFAAAALACALVLIGLDPLWGTTGGSGFREQLTLSFQRASLRDALALGACAAPAAPVAAVAIARSSGNAAAQLINRVTLLNDVAGVVVIGLICAYFRPTDVLSAWKLPHVAWVFFTLGLGGVLGILTYALVRSARSQAEEMALLLGAIALSAGMSGYLSISPLVTCAIAGALLTNLPYKRMRALKETIAQVERPLYLIFLLVAGALWNPRAWQGWVLALVFVLSRVGGKLMGAHVAKRVGPEELPDPDTLGLALAAQSPIAIATIVSYVTIYKNAEGTNAALPWLMTTCIGGAVLTEVVVQLIARSRGGLKLERDMSRPSIVSMTPPRLASDVPPPLPPGAPLPRFPSDHQ